MSPSLPSQEVPKERPPIGVLKTVAILLLILLGVYLIQRMMDQSDPERPPIIISSGSVVVQVGGGDWVADGTKAFKHDFKGKDVKSFTASTGVGTGGSACSVDGKTIVVTYGTKEITFTRKGKVLGFGKNHAFAQFDAEADVTGTSKGVLTVTTGDALVSFRNEDGNNCAVQAGRLEIAQKH
jgi:hypothetical protein